MGGEGDGGAAAMRGRANACGALLPWGVEGFLCAGCGRELRTMGLLWVTSLALSLSLSLSLSHLLWVTALSLSLTHSLTLSRDPGDPGDAAEGGPSPAVSFHSRLFVSLRDCVERGRSERSAARSVLERGRSV
jgi:hypothetical protein